MQELFSKYYLYNQFSYFQIINDLFLIDISRLRVYYIGSIMVKKQFQLNPYLLLILSFLGITLIGSFLLCMPFVFRDNPNNEWCHVGNYLDAFFTSLSAMSLTGITSYPDGLGNTLSAAGQIIILVLMQIGGLGIVTILTFLFSIFRRKLEFKDRLLISQAIAFTNYSEIVKFVRRLIAISITCEIIGFGLGVPLFLKLFPNNVPKAMFHCLFYSVSAFNNVGFDLFEGTGSLINGMNAMGGTFISVDSWLYYYFTIYISFLSLLGGISFLVIIDVVLGHKPPKRWSSFTKISLIMTAGLVLLFSFFLFLTDGLKGDNSITFYEALIQTINCRTAGFSVYALNEISLPGKMICCVMMFIGGSPLSTAGGIKITTVFIIVISIASYFRGKRLSMFKRRYSDEMVAKSMSLVFVVFAILLFAFIGLTFFGTKEVEGYPLDENIKSNLVEYYLFEIFSFFGNVGFYTGLESHLSIGSMIILSLLMLLGHLGPMTFFQLLQNHLDKNANVHYSFVEEDFLIG